MFALERKRIDSVPRFECRGPQQRENLPSSNSGASLFERCAAGRSLCCWKPGAIRECVDHSHLCDATDPDAWRRARQIASSDPFKGASPAEAVAMIEDIMASIGDTCPECK